jgi:hypothetical protein
MFNGRRQMGKHRLARGSNCRLTSGFAEHVGVGDKESNNRGDKYTGLLDIGNWGNTAWHVAAKGGKLQVLQKMWEWAKKKLTTEEISNIMLLETDNLGCTVWQVAANEGKLKLLHEVLDWAEDQRGNVWPQGCTLCWTVCTIKT